MAAFAPGASLWPDRGAAGVSQEAVPGSLCKRLRGEIGYLPPPWPKPGPNVRGRARGAMRVLELSSRETREGKRLRRSSVVRSRFPRNGLPCRRSWVRIPSSAPQEAPLKRVFFCLFRDRRGRVRHARRDADIAKAIASSASASAQSASLSATLASTTAFLASMRCRLRSMWRFKSACISRQWLSPSLAASSPLARSSAARSSASRLASSTFAWISVWERENATQLAASSS